jgi:hypothetical protein
MPDRYSAFAELVENRLAVIETSALLNRREPRPTDVAPSKLLRQAAEEAQAELAPPDYADAKLTVHSMLNQMISLAQAVPWWSSDADAAIAETVDYAAGDHDVSSSPAQQAWDWYRAAKAAFVSVGADLPSLPAGEYHALSQRMDEAGAEWLAAWTDWHASRQAAGDRQT